MADMDSLIKKAPQFLSSKKGRYILGTVFIIFLLFLLFRACSSDKVISHNSYNIGRARTWYFINLMGKEKNMAAFTDDLLATIAKEAHANFTVASASFGDLVEKLHDGEFDGIISILNPGFEYESRLIFSKPYFQLGPVLVLRTNSQLRTWDELKNKIIGIQGQSPSIFEMAEDRSIQLRLYDDPLASLADLDAGKIDGVVLPILEAYSLINTFYANKLRIATAPLTHEGLRLITLNNPKGKKLVTLFNEGLDEAKKDGTYEALLINWGLMNSEK